MHKDIRYQDVKRQGGSKHESVKPSEPTNPRNSDTGKQEHGHSAQHRIRKCTIALEDEESMVERKWRTGQGDPGDLPKGTEKNQNPQHHRPPPRLAQHVMEITPLFYAD